MKTRIVKVAGVSYCPLWERTGSAQGQLGHPRWSVRRNGHKKGSSVYQDGSAVLLGHAWRWLLESAAKARQLAAQKGNTPVAVRCEFFWRATGLC